MNVYDDLMMYLMLLSDNSLMGPISIIFCVHPFLHKLHENSTIHAPCIATTGGSWTYGRDFEEV